MRILFVCDLNSIHSQKWIKYFIDRKFNVYIYSTTPFRDGFHGARVFSERPPVVETKGSGKMLATFFKLRPAWFVMAIAEKAFLRKKVSTIKSSTFAHKNAVMDILHSVNPDVVHSLRIPNEGFIGSMLPTDVPLVVSTWGNDLTYWARMSSFRRLTENTLRRADFLFTDCERDIRLSHELGFAQEKPFLVLPGSGGMMQDDLEIGRLSLESRTDFFKDNFQIDRRPVFLSLRGFGSQDIDNVPLLRACKLLVDKGGAFRLIIVGKRTGFRFHKLMRLIKIHRLDKNVFLIDELPHAKALEALRGSDFSISISHNDGTPNSMLEAMTFGAIPLMSEIESIKEWITDGTNGYLFDPSVPKSIADTMQRAIAEEKKRISMRRLNYELIVNRADYIRNMEKAERELSRLVGKT